MNTWENDCFNKLGNEIMFELVSEVDPIDAEALKLLGHDTPDKREERMRKLKESMKASTARFDYGDYPWNAVSPTRNSCLQCRDCVLKQGLGPKFQTLSTDHIPNFSVPKSC